MKHTYKITPVSLYDIQGVESWLEDMARRGLHLKRLRTTVSVFEKGPARFTRYRAEPFRRILGEDPPQSMVELYQDFGWDLACSVNADLLIFSTQDPDAPEPHSDPELQGRLWKKLYKAKRREIWGQLAVLLVLLWVLSENLFKENMPVRSLVTSMVPFLFAELVVLAVLLAISWSDADRLALLVRQLEQHIPLEHRTVYLPHRWVQTLSHVMLTVLLLSVLIYPFSQIFTRDRLKPLDDLTAFPMMSLAELEGEDYEPARFKEDGPDYANFCSRERCLLCPEYWRVVQTGHIEPENWTRMEIERYDLPGWLSGLSVPLARELLESGMGLHQDIWWTGNDNQVWTVDYIPYEGVSFLAAARTGGFQVAAAAVGDKAVLVKYTGQGNLEEHLEEIVHMVQ